MNSPKAIKIFDKMKNMEEILKQYLQQLLNVNEDLVYWQYAEDINPDATTDKWLGNKTSYIYKVGVLTAIDVNKCGGWVRAVIGTQRSKRSDVLIVGGFSFQEGENDNIGRVLNRAMRLLSDIHPVFNQD